MQTRRREMIVDRGLEINRKLRWNGPGGGSKRGVTRVNDLRAVVESCAPVIWEQLYSGRVVVWLAYNLGAAAAAGQSAVLLSPSPKQLMLITVSKPNRRENIICLQGAHY